MLIRPLSRLYQLLKFLFSEEPELNINGSSILFMRDGTVWFRGKNHIVMDYNLMFLRGYNARNSGDAWHLMNEFDKSLPRYESELAEHTEKDFKAGMEALEYEPQIRKGCRGCKGKIV